MQKHTYKEQVSRVYNGFTSCSTHNRSFWRQLGQVFTVYTDRFYQTYLRHASSSVLYHLSLGNPPRRWMEAMGNLAS